MRPKQTHHFRWGGASVKLEQLDPGVYALSTLYSMNRGHGDARELMRSVVEYADEHGITLRLIVQQFGDIYGLDNHQLAAFYERFGFVRDTKPQPLPVCMTRRPNSQETQPL